MCDEKNKNAGNVPAFIDTFDLGIAINDRCYWGVPNGGRQVKPSLDKL